MSGAFLKILEMTLTGSIVIAVVLLIRLLLKRAPKIYSYLLWSVVLFRLLCPLSITASLSVLEPIPVTTTPGISSVSYRPMQQAAKISNEISTAPRDETDAPAAEPSKPRPSPLAIVSYVWLAGAACLALSGLTQYFLLRRKLTEAISLEGNVYLADGISTPFVMGLLRPRVYLPSSVKEWERSFILAHERHHIRRGDPAWKLLGYLALCLHWFNPLAWLCFCLAGKDMEMSCDEAVIRQLGEDVRADYAQALLQLASHKRIIAGMPLAFGEGDTKDRVRNLARWKQPKVWLSALCAGICLVVLAACALNPKQEAADSGPTQGPADIAIGQLSFVLPEGCTMENADADTDQNGFPGPFTLTDGTNVIGGVTVYSLPVSYSADSVEWVMELPMPEWDMPDVSYMADNRGVSFFSDVPEGQEKTVSTEHYLYVWEDRVYDLWFDNLTVEFLTEVQIRDSVHLGPSHTVLPYQVGDLPEGYLADVTSREGIQIRTADGVVVGAITAYTIPKGVYDAKDKGYTWLEDVGIPDLEELQLSGMFAWDGGDGCSMTLTDDFQNPTVQRTHRFTVAGNTVYDFWLDDLLVDPGTQFAIDDAISFLPPEEAVGQELSQEDLIFQKCQAVMDLAQSSSAIWIRTSCHYGNTPEKDYVEDFYYDKDIGFMRFRVNTDGSTTAELYDDDYYTAAGAVGDTALSWAPARAPETIALPWLSSFNFVKRYVSYGDPLNAEEGVGYLFRANVPFSEEADTAPVYWPSFFFDAEGNFKEVTLQINAAMDNSYTLAESIVSTDRAEISGKLRDEIARAKSGT